MYIKVQETVGVEGNERNIEASSGLLHHLISRMPRVFKFISEVGRLQ